MTVCEVLALVFVVLKLCGVINWSWWWVIAPIWLPIVSGFVVGVLWFLLRALFEGGRQ